MYKPLMNKIGTQVLPEVFHPEREEITNYEGVSYWQSRNTKASINVTPAIPVAGGGQTAGTAVSLDYVVGILFDEEALVTDFQLENAYTTPIEARKHYRNTWFTFAKNNINNLTHNAILFYLG